ncbi:ATP-binding cassette domain-containing protein [Streptomyces sp. NPDC008001]|uniref:ATP-binding cassette domain-containing protein n=1 Tax=Streptomyces sp. NPDC008001 TaxID=3364804 RepID=UPI0036E33BF0
MKLKSKSDPAEPEGSESERLLFGGPLLHNARWAEHHNAYFTMSLWAMALQLPRLVTFTVRLARRAERRALWVVGAGELARGVSQAIGLIAINSVLATVLATGSIEYRVQAAVPAMIGVAVTGIFGALATAASTAGSGRLEPKVERVATEMYLAHVMKVELAAIENADFHRLMDSAQFGAGAARRMVNQCTGVVGSLVSFVAAAGVLTVLHPALLPILALMTVPRSWASLRNSRARYGSYFQWMQHARAGRLLSQTLMRTDPAPEIRVHKVGPLLLHHFRQMSEASEAEQSRLADSRARVRLAASALTGVAAALTYTALGVLLATGAIALSVAGTAVLAIRTGGQSLSTLVLQVNNLYEEACYVQDLERLFQEAARHQIPEGGAPVPSDLAVIRFENVTFQYPDDSDEYSEGPRRTEQEKRPALKNVSLDVPVGKIVALVGENGSGKTTVSKLLAGLYQPDSGSVRWNGTDARELDRAQLFHRVGMVSQDFHRWPFTFRMNIAIGRPERPLDEKVLEAVAGAAALDAKAELEVFEQIRKLADGGRTVILITHRLASVRHADLIHVLDKGELRESGTFEELLTLPDGAFRTLYEMQARQFRDAALPSQRHPADAAERSDAR